MATSLWLQVLSLVPPLSDCESNTTVPHSALQGGHLVMDSCPFLDEHCEETSLSASSFSLQVLPLVLPLLDGGSPATKPHRDPQSTHIPMDSCSSLDEHYEEASLSASRFSLQVLPLVPFHWMVRVIQQSLMGRVMQ